MFGVWKQNRLQFTCRMSQPGRDGLETGCVPPADWVWCDSNSNARKLLLRFTSCSEASVSLLLQCDRTITEQMCSASCWLKGGAWRVNQFTCGRDSRTWLSQKCFQHSQKKKICCGCFQRKVCGERQPVAASGALFWTILLLYTIIYHKDGGELCFQTCEHNQTYEVWWYRCDRWVEKVTPFSVTRTQIPAFNSETWKSRELLRLAPWTWTPIRSVWSA